jgi:hypothetical protein
MLDIVAEIKHFNESRNLLENPCSFGEEISRLYEEMHEFTKAKNDEERIDAIADVIVFMIGIGLKNKGVIITLPNEIIGNVSELSLDEKRQELARIILDFDKRFKEDKGVVLRASLHELMLLIYAFEYNPHQVMEEVCKHINSDSGEGYTDESGKYIKGKRTYQPDFNRCKLEIKFMVS